MRVAVSRILNRKFSILKRLVFVALTQYCSDKALLLCQSAIISTLTRIYRNNVNGEFGLNDTMTRILTWQYQKIAIITVGVLLVSKSHKT